jgi:type III secretory pathway component EscR
VCPMESYLHLPEKMDHNEFQLDEDLIEPFREFIQRLQEQYKKNDFEESKTSSKPKKEAPPIIKKTTSSSIDQNPMIVSQKEL